MPTTSRSRAGRSEILAGAALLLHPGKISAHRSRDHFVSPGRVTLDLTANAEG